MRNLRILFMGTPDFAVQTLHALLEHNYTIAAVVTAPDKPAGRGRKVQQSAVKKYAVSKNITVLQPVRLKDEEFLGELRLLNANLFVVVAFRMLPKVVWEMPEYGTFNLHASLLPDYRGAAPINWAIINGEHKTGVSTFFIDEKIDTGEIILQETVKIEETETAGELHDKLMHTGAGLVLKTVSLIEKNAVIPVKQKENGNLKTAPKIHKDTCRINWSKPVDELYDFIRGLSPYPAAWTILKNDTEEFPIKIYKAAKEKTVHSYANGTVLHNKKQIKVAVSGGFLHLTEMQFPGKRKMDSTAILNGFKLSTEAKVL